MHTMRSLAITLGLVLALGACGDDGPTDLGPSFDLSGPDLPITLPDLSSCPAPSFNGFPGDSDAERRLDCTGCGCSIDPLSSAALTGLWARTLLSAEITDEADGLAIRADGSQGPAFASLSSLNPGGDFYLDGDFDLRIDYALGQLVRGGKVSLRIDVTSGLFWEVARARPVDAFEAHFGSLGGVVASKPSTSESGTLRLVRQGLTIIAYANGEEIGKTFSGAAGRAAIFFSAGVTGCDSADGGAVDGGSACVLTAKLRDLRLASGAIVDRR